MVLFVVFTYFNISLKSDLRQQKVRNYTECFGLVQIADKIIGSGHLNS